MANDTTVAPIVVEPSQAWDGNDGPWSTFYINVGTPPQPTRVLISTAVGETWVVSANTTQGGCNSQDPKSCPESRGKLFNVNASSTWQDQGIYGLGLEANLPDYLDSYGNGDFGFETVGLGLPGSDGIQEPDMVVSAIATKEYYLGYLGLDIYPTNFSEFTHPRQSFLSTLKEQSKIPSLSYAYSAGAEYRFKKVDATLTLGGYDASKFVPNNASFNFASDISRDLVLGLQSITFNDAKSTNQVLLSDGILTFIDSTVPHIWLPQDACTLFEDAFGITYNSTIDRYLVNDTLHQQLQSQDASVSFILGNDVSGGETVNITLPYAAFDLQIGPPFVETTQHYFPLRRAANETQFTLGRTFLQEAYLIVDNEWKNFSVSQNVWVENAPSEILAIRSPNSTQPIIPPTHKSGISIGTIVGIIVGAVVLLLLAAIASFFIIRKRRRRRAQAKLNEDDDDAFRKPEMDGTGKPPIGELYAEGKIGEADSSSKVEMQGSQPGMSLSDKKNAAEIDGNIGALEMEGTKGGVEMEGTKGGAEMAGSHLRAEMAGDHLAPVELYAGPQGLLELPSPNTSNSDLPSPISANNDRRSGLSPTWSRRQKVMPNLPGYENSDVSPDQDSPGRNSDAGGWSERRSRGVQRSHTPNAVSSPSSESRERRPSGNSSNSISSPSPNSRHRRPTGPSPQNTGLESMSRSTTPMDISSQSSGRRERQRNRGNALDRRMESSSNQASPIDTSSPQDRGLRRANSAEEWNRRFGSRERIAAPRSPDILSPVSPAERTEMVDRRRPSPLGNTARPGTEIPTQRPPPAPPGNFF